MAFRPSSNDVQRVTVRASHGPCFPASAGTGDRQIRLPRARSPVIDLRPIAALCVLAWRCDIARAKLKCTRFRGDLSVMKEGVRDGEDQAVVSAQSETVAHPRCAPTAGLRLDRGRPTPRACQPAHAGELQRLSRHDAHRDGAPSATRKDAQPDPRLAGVHDVFSTRFSRAVARTPCKSAAVCHPVAFDTTM